MGARARNRDAHAPRWKDAARGRFGSLRLGRSRGGEEPSLPLDEAAVVERLVDGLFPL